MRLTVCTLAVFTMILGALEAPALAQGKNDARTLRKQCREAVKKVHPEGTLSIKRGERNRLVDQCVAKGGKLS